MAKKDKKIYKASPVLAPKISLNHKWTSWRQVETKNRLANANNAEKKLLLLSLWKDHQVENTRLSFNIKMDLQHRIWYMDKRSSISKLRNYCHYIGRSRGLTRKLFMARHTFRKFARFGMLPGFVKERC
jgi:ribosomal protein S14